MSVTLLLAVSAFVATLASAIWKAPLWIAVFLLCLIELLGLVPRG